MRFEPHSSARTSSTSPPQWSIIVGVPQMAAASAPENLALRISTRFNQHVECDILFYKDQMILHLVCCASR